jgi:multisubunit Na+/H+ antiporter MnhB subunit
VLTVISPGGATVQCVIETGTTALTGTTTITVTSESGQTTQFIFDPTNGLR